MIKYCCPICKGPLLYEKSIDRFQIVKIIDLGDNNLNLDILHNKSNDYELVFCQSHKYVHIIPKDFRDEIITLIREKTK